MGADMSFETQEGVMAKYCLRKQFGLGDVFALFFDLRKPDGTMLPLEEVKFLSLRECYSTNRRGELVAEGFEENGIVHEVRIPRKLIEVFRDPGRAVEKALVRAYCKEAMDRKRPDADARTITPNIRWRLLEFVRGSLLALSEDATNEERKTVLTNLLQYLAVACEVLRNDAAVDPLQVDAILNAYLAQSPNATVGRVRWSERDRLWRAAVQSFYWLGQDWRQNAAALESAEHMDVSLTTVRGEGDIAHAAVSENVSCIAVDADGPYIMKAARNRGARVVIQIAEHGNRILVSADRLRGATKQAGLIHVAAVLRMADVHARTGALPTENAVVFEKGLPCFDDLSMTFVLGETEAWVGNLDASLPESALSKEELLRCVIQALWLDVSDLGPTFPVNELYWRLCPIAVAHGQ